jgi:hypothetical protein
MVRLYKGLIPAPSRRIIIFKAIDWPEKIGAEY